MGNILIKLIVFLLVISLTYGINKQFQRVPDANDIYDNYFSQYHFTEEAKHELMAELKLIVNYLSYEKSKGNDYQKEISFLQDYTKQKISSDQFLDEVLSLKKSCSPSELTKVSRPNLSDTSSYCAGFSSFLATQREIIQLYRLPYTVDNSALQILDISASVSAKDTLYDTVLPDKSPGKTMLIKQQLNTLHSFNWQSADILLAHLTTASHDAAIQGYYNHSGIYSEACECIVDAAPPIGSINFQGGVRKSDWKYWEENYSDFVILRFPQLPASKKKQIEAYALSKLDAPYNLMTYKKSEESGWYCSKLIYMSYLNAGINLDNKNGVSIFPDDLAMGFSSGTFFCLDRSNRSIAKNVVIDTN